MNHHHLLADAGLEPRRHYFIVMDELWRALRPGPDMVNRIDGLTRLNRNVGVGQAMCSHTMSDQLTLPTEAERMKAAGFVERAGMVALGGCRRGRCRCSSRPGSGRPARKPPTAQILTEQGYPLNAAGVREIVNAPDKQRAGVYGTAQTVMSFCTNRAAMTWCTPDPRRRRPHFDPDAFARSTDTLYCASKEGRGSTAGLVTALTVAVAAAAERLGERSRGGRLPVPMVFVLDEAANVCRRPQLPNLYSHFGSRGISVLTIVQFWDQGAEVWGRDGMTKRWGAATVKVVGSGVSGPTSCRTCPRSSVTTTPPNCRCPPATGKAPATAARSRRSGPWTSPTSPPPKGRAIVLAAGAQLALCRTRPWMTGPHAERSGLPSLDTTRPPP